MHMQAGTVGNVKFADSPRVNKVTKGTGNGGWYDGALFGGYSMARGKTQGQAGRDDGG